MSEDDTLKSPSPEKLKRDVTTPYLLRRLKQTKYAHILPAQHYSSEESDTTDSRLVKLKQVLEPYSSFFLAVFGKSCYST